jgi:hypothetical protein
MKKNLLPVLLVVAVITIAVLVLFTGKDTAVPDKQPDENKTKETIPENTAPPANQEIEHTPIEKNMTRLQVEYPDALFEGTPKSVRTPNLERNPSMTEIMVPTETAQLAKGKKVTGSDDFPVIGELEYITDGDKDGVDGSYVEFGPGVQWVQIDLGEAKTIHAVALWHYHAQARAYRDVIVQIADDADFVENVQTVFNNDHDNSAGLGIGKDKEYVETNKGKLVDAKGVQGQFVRLYSNGSTGSDMNHYIEVEVFGK